jgi:thiol-disulfide isomerase/thioredoxin
MDPMLLRGLLVLAGLVVLVLAARWWQARDGRVREADDDAPALHDDHLDALGLDLAGAAAGAVLFGSPTCTPCDTVKRVLGELETERDGFRWVYADAADHLDLTREHGVMRVPTLLVVGPSGQIVARTSGVPDPDELRRVLDEGDALAA